MRTNLSANFSSEGWTGPASDHYLAKKQGLESFRGGETDPNVLRWRRTPWTFGAVVPLRYE